jgi:hypothetical protein
LPIEQGRYKGLATADARIELANTRVKTTHETLTRAIYGIEAALPQNNNNKRDKLERALDRAQRAHLKACQVAAALEGQGTRQMHLLLDTAGPSITDTSPTQVGETLYASSSIVAPVSTCE